MQYYRDHLSEKGFSVTYIDSSDDLSDIRNLIPHLAGSGVSQAHIVDPTDDWLQKRIDQAVKQAGIGLTCHPSPMFFNTREELFDYFGSRKRMFQANFYIHQRKKRGILVDGKGSPVGGKWSFDAENRKKYPRGKAPPAITMPRENKYLKSARVHVSQNYDANPGELPGPVSFPVTHHDASLWLDEFLGHRLTEFGSYEDAIVDQEHFLHHSLLTPMLNTGLITPDVVLERAIAIASDKRVPINSLEGFTRQVLGWREFIRAVYLLRGAQQRTTNFWGFSRKIPDSFWFGETGIYPVDNVIRKVLKTGYAHHIERLMVLGNFMLLCEFDPDEVYRWFMELFADAYDWVMVPNVYGMSQFADGGIMSTKPYISASNYLLKMSDYPKGEWQSVWDALFWRFMHEHRDFFSQHPRMGMLLKTFDRMSEQKSARHLETAQKFLSELN